MNAPTAEVSPQFIRIPTSREVRLSLLRSRKAEHRQAIIDDHIVPHEILSERVFNRISDGRKRGSGTSCEPTFMNLQTNSPLDLYLSPLQNVWLNKSSRVATTLSAPILSQQNAIEQSERSIMISRTTTTTTSHLETSNRQGCLGSRLQSIPRPRTTLPAMRRLVRLTLLPNKRSHVRHLPDSPRHPGCYCAYTRWRKTSSKWKGWTNSSSRPRTRRLRRQVRTLDVPIAVSRSSKARAL